MDAHPSTTHTDLPVLCNGSDLTTAALEAVWAKDSNMDRKRATEFIKLLVTVTSLKTGEGIVEACETAQANFIAALMKPA